MPYPLNNVATADTYGDPATTIFPWATNAFSVQVYNASVAYRLLYVPKSSLQTAAYQADLAEHFIGPSFADFDESDLPAGMTFAGVQFRSWVPGKSANVTVT